MLLGTWTTFSRTAGDGGDCKPWRPESHRPSVLETLERRASRQGGRRDGAQGDRQPKKSELHCNHC